MSTIAIQLSGVGKMYKLYRRPADKVLDALGVSRFVPSFESRYREFWALRGLDLTIGRGERMGLIGRNGSGKSTMLKVISGNVPATEGRVTVHGNVQALMELGTGFHPEFTGRENIRASLAYHGLSTRRIKEVEEEIIDFTELEEFIDQPVKTYSAGMYARLAFSTATSIEPEILIIDEVLGAGDAYFSGKCVERMKRLTEGSGATVLFVSHDLGSVQQLCERVIWVDRGQIAMDGSPLDVTKAYYASILRQEELRLRARNARLGRRQIKDLQTREDTEHIKEVLLRFVTHSGEPPGKTHPIQRITLRCGSCIETITPGGPMDNDASQSAYLMTDPTYMLWSEPVLVGGRRVRCVTATGGQYGHAPMVFGVPTSVWQSGHAGIEVDHASVAGDTINVEYFDGRGYRILGVLEASQQPWMRQSFTINVAAAPIKIDAAEDVRDVPGSEVSDDASVDTDPVLHQRDTEKFYSQYAEFHRIDTIDEHGRSRVLFGPGESFGLFVEAEIRRPIPECEFAVAVYNLSNSVIAAFWWRLASGLEIGRYRWRIFVRRPNLRQDTYVLSCALLRERPILSNENLVYYSAWNRANSIKIDEGRVSNVPMGIVSLSTDPPQDTDLMPERIGVHAIHVRPGVQPDGFGVMGSPP